MSLQIIETLYHGTISQIQTIDVTKGRDNKDFGKGFYMATTKKQAIGMMHKKYTEIQNRIKNKYQGRIFTERLYEIQIDFDYAEKLNIKHFEQADMEWLNFVLTCREQGGTPHNYDLVIGPTAEDNTLICLRAYWQEFYGKVGTEEAKEILLKNLEPENLGIQYFIGKQHIADKLIKNFHEIDWRRI